MKYLPPSVRDDYELRGAWIRNNLTYLDALLLELYLEKDYTYLSFTWPEYHYKHACRLGVCSNILNIQDMFSLSTPTAVLHSCRVCYDPTLPNPHIYPSRTTVEIWAQFQNRYSSIERVGPCIPPRHPMDCWYKLDKTLADEPIVMPVHPPHIPLLSPNVYPPVNLMSRPRLRLRRRSRRRLSFRPNLFLHPPPALRPRRRKKKKKNLRRTYREGSATQVRVFYGRMDGRFPLFTYTYLLSNRIRALVLVCLHVRNVRQLWSVIVPDGAAIAT